MLELLYQSTRTINLGADWPNAVYLASWDAVLFRSTDFFTSDFRKVFRDGRYFDMGQANFTGAYLSAEGGRGAASIYRYVHDDGYYDEYNIVLIDEISGLPLLGQYRNGVNFDGKISNGSFIDHTGKNVYTPTSYFSSGGVGYIGVKVYALADGSLVRTLDVPFSGAIIPSYVRLHYVDSASLLMAAYLDGDGNIVIFDRISGGVSFKGAIPGIQAAVFDSTHRVIIAIMPTGQVMTYALNNLGYALSSPSFSPAPALLTLSKVTTRLTGEDGQPVAGKGVLWLLTGDKGSLESMVTMTDSGGYAYNWYYGPAGDYGLGEETLNVEVAV